MGNIRRNSQIIPILLDSSGGLLPGIGVVQEGSSGAFFLPLRLCAANRHNGRVLGDPFLSRADSDRLKKVSSFHSRSVLPTPNRFGPPCDAERVPRRKHASSSKAHGGLRLFLLAWIF